MTTMMAEEHWQTLLSRIRAGRCTPLLGAGVSSIVAAQVARSWAAQYDYPLRDRDNLARVSKYVAVTSGDSMTPKEMMAVLVKSARRPDAMPATDVYNVLASLPIRVYVTTNYDDELERALQRRKKRFTSESYH